eukprot:PLAT14743.1.p1 GENE.PLAT14743.1~~PLAT14743.1.p1  ORF type:complete len:284 (+),score=137.78 PLAT14743.1:24-854(+)
MDALAAIIDSRAPRLQPVVLPRTHAKLVADMLALAAASQEEVAELELSSKAAAAHAALLASRCCAVCGTAVPSGGGQLALDSRFDVKASATVLSGLRLLCGGCAQLTSVRDLIGVTSAVPAKLKERAERMTAAVDHFAAVHRLSVEEAAIALQEAVCAAFSLQALLRYATGARVVLAAPAGEQHEVASSVAAESLLEGLLLITAEQGKKQKKKSSKKNEKRTKAVKRSRRVEEEEEESKDEDEEDEDEDSSDEEVEGEPVRKKRKRGRSRRSRSRR